MDDLEAYNKENNNSDITVPLTLLREVIWTSIDLQLDKHRKKYFFGNFKILSTRKI